MATIADAEALGFICPTGTDLVRDGDNAITTNAVKTVEQLGAWKTWAPTWTAVGINAVARHHTTHALSHIRIDGKLTSVPTGPVRFTLPSAAFAGTGDPELAIVHAKKASGTYVLGVAILASGSTCRIMFPVSATNNNLTDMSATVPFTWSAGDWVHIRGFFEPS